MPATKTKAAKTTKPVKPAARAKTSAKKPPERMSLAEAMRTLEKAGSAQTRKTYARHGAKDPMFGVSFATLKTLVKRIRVDHDLALALWETGNFDARNLAFKIADPARMTPGDLDRWARETEARMCSWYPAMLAAEGPHAMATATRWLSSKEELLRSTGWGLVGQLAGRDPTTPDSWFADRLAQIEKTLQSSSNGERYAMNNALIAIGGRSPALRKAALAAAKRIGKVEVDHGDTACETPVADLYIEKMWAHAKAKGFPTPSVQEQARETPRTRC
jgi:3-methyladenine DNA glycosylase AlkD